MVIPIVVHLIAAAAVICVAVDHGAAWTLGVVVVVSAVYDAAKLRSELRLQRTLVMHGRVMTLDGVDAYAASAWLGPGLTVVWLRRRDGRRATVTLFRSELTAAQHAAMRRHLRSLDFRQ